MGHGFLIAGRGSLLALRRPRLSVADREHAESPCRIEINQAVRWNLMVRNIAALVDLPRISKHEVQVLAPDQAKAFVKAADANRLGALFLVALAVGLRSASRF